MSKSSRSLEQDLARIDFKGCLFGAAMFVAIALVFLIAAGALLAAGDPTAWIAFMLTALSLGGTIPLTIRAVHHYRLSKPTEADRNQERWDQAKDALWDKQRRNSELRREWEEDFRKLEGITDKDWHIRTTNEVRAEFSEPGQKHLNDWKDWHRRTTNTIRTTVDADGDTTYLRGWGNL